MSRLFPVAALALAACSSTPPPEPAAVPAAAETAANAHDHRSLEGMTANELIAHFGKPRLQIREGQGTKLQFAGTTCVLDTYLYPPASNAEAPRVAYIEARNLQGADVAAQGCVYAIEAQRGIR